MTFSDRVTRVSIYVCRVAGESAILVARVSYTMKKVGNDSYRLSQLY